MQKRGIEFASYWQVDNSLINILTRCSSGCTHLTGEMSSKGLSKTGPFEKLGNFCLVAASNVIEYSDLHDELAEKRIPTARLLLSLAVSRFIL